MAESDQTTSEIGGKWTVYCNTSSQSLFFTLFSASPSHSFFVGLSVAGSRCHCGSAAWGGAGHAISWQHLPDLDQRIGKGQTHTETAFRPKKKKTMGHALLPWPPSGEGHPARVSAQYSTTRSDWLELVIEVLRLRSGFMVQAITCRASRVSDWCRVAGTDWLKFEV